MDKNRLDKLLTSYFLKPFSEKKESYIGVEVELPVVKLNRSSANEKILQKLMLSLISKFSFQPVKQDREGNIISILDAETKDMIAFEYSIHMLEFSLGKGKSLKDLAQRFYTYIEHVQNFLMAHNHILTGFGVHPHANKIDLAPLNHIYYNMLHHYMLLTNSTKSYYTPDFFAIINAVQTHIDCKPEEIPELITFFSKLDWINAILFSNSLWLMEEGISKDDCFCYRDLIYRESTIGSQPNDLGAYNRPLTNLDEVLNEISEISMWRIKKEDYYVFFNPVSIKNFFDGSYVTGYQIDNDFNLKKHSFLPEGEQIKYFKSFKNIAFTHCGTLELRGTCQQPISKTFSPIAFAIGCMVNRGPISQRLQEFNPKSSNSDLRDAAIFKNIQAIAPSKILSDLLTDIIDLSYKGLKKRGYGEEIYIDDLFERAKQISCPAKENLAFLSSQGTVSELIIKHSELPN